MSSTSSSTSSVDAASNMASTSASTSASMSAASSATPHHHSKSSMKGMRGEAANCSFRTIGGREVAIIWFYSKKHPRNIIDNQFVIEMNHILERVTYLGLEKLIDYVVVCSRRESSFVVGADLSLQLQFRSSETAAASAASFKTVLNQLENLPVATICVLNGPTLGGGLEIALACDYRIADEKATSIGLPEVLAGLIPGAGGCVRLPRLIGLRQALSLIVSGQMINAAKAKKLGIVDALFSSTQWPIDSEMSLPDWAREMTAHWTDGQMQNVIPLENKYSSLMLGCTWLEQQVLYTAAVAQTTKVTKKRFPAPYIAIKTVFACWNAEYTQAMEMETAAYSQLCMTPESKALITLFLARSHAKHRCYDHFESRLLPSLAASGAIVQGPLQPMPHVFVLGSGYMGGGIGLALACKGARVTFYDVSQPSLFALEKRVSETLTRRIKRGHMREEKAAHIKSSIKYTTTLHLPNAAQGPLIVLECVPEQLDLKLDILRKVQMQRPDAVFASNTSTIPISHIAEGAIRPDRVIGMHFFHPDSNVTPIVEICPTPKTAGEVGWKITRLAESMGKVPVLVGEGRGFVMNRVASPWYGLATHLVVIGAASISHVNKACERFGFAAGPLATFDGVGLTTAHKVNQAMIQDLPAIETSSLLLKRMVEKGLEGRRAGKDISEGFFVYKNGKSAGPSKKCTALAEDVRKELGVDPPLRQLSDQDITDLLVFSMVNMACQTLEEGVAQSAEELDMLTILAQGFPPNHGGLLAYADRVGIKYVRDRLAEFAVLLQMPMLAPSSMLNKMIEEGSVFRKDLAGVPPVSSEGYSLPVIIPQRPSALELAALVGVIAGVGAYIYHKL